MLAVGICKMELVMERHWQLVAVGVRGYIYLN